MAWRNSPVTVCYWGFVFLGTKLILTPSASLASFSHHQLAFLPQPHPRKLGEYLQVVIVLQHILRELSHLTQPPTANCPVKDSVPIKVWAVLATFFFHFYTASHYQNIHMNNPEEERLQLQRFVSTVSCTGSLSSHGEVGYRGGGKRLFTSWQTGKRPGQDELKASFPRPTHSV